MKKVKKGPICYVYYAIKNKRQSRLEEEQRISEKNEHLEYSQKFL